MKIILRIREHEQLCCSCCLMSDLTQEIVGQSTATHYFVHDISISGFISYYFLCPQ